MTKRKIRRIAIRELVNEEGIALRKWAVTPHVEKTQGDWGSVDDCQCVARSILASIARIYGREPDGFICRRTLYNDPIYCSSGTSPGSAHCDVSVAYQYNSVWARITVAVDY